MLKKKNEANNAPNVADMEDEDLVGDSVDDEDFDDMDDADQGPLFWSLKVEPNKPADLEQPAIPGYIIHITNACFGADVVKQSRTVVMVNPNPEENKTDLEAPVCVLRQGQDENHSLDLLFNESARFALKGQKPSTVYLTGYIQPPVEAADDSMLDPMAEDIDEEEIGKLLKRQKRHQQALDDEVAAEEEHEEPQLIADDDDDDDDDEVEEIPAPPSKKQKTTTGSKPTKNGGNNNEQSTTKRKSPQQKAKPAPQQKPTESITLSDDKKEDEDEKDKETKTAKNKNEKKNEKKKDKKMQTMKGGIKYRDMKIGEGNTIKHGQRLKVLYVGQTDDKKVFDKCIGGAGFEFNFGKGDVIKGWDQGLKGMKVGGKRKLIIPPKLAYGANGSAPSIPPNATLTFTIEVKEAN